MKGKKTKCLGTKLINHPLKKPLKSWKTVRTRQHMCRSIEKKLPADERDTQNFYINWGYPRNMHRQIGGGDHCQT